MYSLISSVNIVAFYQRLIFQGNCYLDLTLSLHKEVKRII